MDIVLDTEFTNPTLPDVSETIWADTFNRADALTLGSTDTGALPWVVSAASPGAFGIGTNRGKVVTAGSGTGFATVNAGAARLRFRCAIAIQNASGNAGLVFRYVDESNHYGVGRFSSTDITWRIFKRTTALGVVTIKHLSAPMTSGDVWEFDDEDDTRLRIYLNGALVFDELVDTAVGVAELRTATRQGLYTGSVTTAVAWDDARAYTTL